MSLMMKAAQKKRSADNERDNDVADRSGWKRNKVDVQSIGSKENDTVKGVSLRDMLVKANEYGNHDENQKYQKDSQQQMQRGGKAQQRTATLAKVAESTDEDGNVVFELTPKRRVTVRKWRSTVLADIREFYDDKGMDKPGKKGISLSVDQWRTLVKLSESIEEAIRLVEDDNVNAESLADVPERIADTGEERSVAFSLSTKRRLSVRFFRSSVLIDIREFYEQDGVTKPGKKGISLLKEQWETLHGALQHISDAMEQL